MPREYQASSLFPAFSRLPFSLARDEVSIFCVLFFFLLKGFPENVRSTCTPFPTPVPLPEDKVQGTCVLKSSSCEMFSFREVSHIGEIIDISGWIQTGLER